MFRGVSHIYLPVGDVDGAVKFYTEHLGFRLQRKWRIGDGPESAYLVLNGVLLELTRGSAATPPPEGAPRTYRFGLEVDNLDAAVDELKSKGVEFEREPFDARTFWGRQAALRDPFGNLI